MTIYPVRESEKVLFRENFTNPGSVAKNGGTVNGTPTIDNGATLDGTTDDITYETGDFLSDASDVTFEVWFSPDFDYDADTNYAFYSTDATERYSLTKLNNGSGNILRVNLGSINFDIASATYSPYWNVGERNHVVVSAVSGDTSVYLNNNVVLDSSASAWATKKVTLFEIGSYNPDLNFDGTIYSVSVYKEKWTAQEVEDAYNKDTFTKIDASKTLVTLPLRGAYDDSGYKTENIGSLGSTAVWGDGSTAGTFPTLIGTHGIELDGVAEFVDLKTLVSTELDLATNITVCALIKPSEAAVAGLDAVMSSSATNSLFHFQTNTGYMNAAIYLSGGNATLTSTVALQAGVYQHVCFTFEGATGEAILYQDGAVVDTDTGGGGLSAIGANNFYLGRGFSNSRYFDGCIIDPSICLSTLTPTQVRELANVSLRQINS